MTDNMQIEIETKMDILESELAEEGGDVGGDAFHWHNNFIAGIVNRKDLFLKALRFMRPDFLDFSMYKKVLQMYIEFYDEHKKHLHLSDVRQYIAESEIDDIVETTITIACRDAGEIIEEQFDVAMKNIMKQQKDRLFNKRIMEAVRKKKKGEIERADSILEKYLAEFKHLDEQEEPIKAGEGVWQLQEKGGQGMYQYMTYLDEIDEITGGGYRGETWIVGGYTGDGKTALTKEIVYNNIKAGERCFFVSLEMNNREMLSLFATREAQQMGYENLTLWKIRHRKFDNDIERGQFQNVIEEMKSWDNLFLYNPKGKFTIRDLEIEIERISAKVDLDIVVVDYLELLDSVRRYSSYRIEVKETMRVAKRLANEKDIWVIIPHQISRHGRKEAENRKPFPHYLLSDLQESSGVEQNCTVMLWIYKDGELAELNRCRAGISKNRMGKTCVVGWEMYADYSRCYFECDGELLAGQIEIED